MRTMFIMFFLSFSSCVISQENSLYLFYNPDSKVEVIGSLRDEDAIAVYNFNLNTNDAYTKLYIDNEGRVKKNITMGSTPSNYVSFKYNNLKNNNVPILVDENQIKNSISFHEMINTDYEGLLKILRHFKNIYIIYSPDLFNGYYVARKVEFELGKGKL